jgi:hypothetical protein
MRKMQLSSQCLTVKFERLLEIVKGKVILEDTKSFIKLKKHEFGSLRISLAIILWHISHEQSSPLWTREEGKGSETKKKGKRKLTSRFLS